MDPDAVHVARDREVALRALRRILRPGDVVLLKASNGERFFDLVDELHRAEPAGVRGVTIAAGVVQGILLTFALMVILMPPFIALLRRLGFGKRIRAEGPASHFIKEGTPTMGGVLMIAVVGAATLLFQFINGNFWGPQTIAPILTLLFIGGLGAFDDYLNATTGEGIRIRQKLLWQVAASLFIAYQVQTTYAIRSLTVPFVGDVPIEPWAWILFAAFTIVATSNGVNFTDGLDGLAGGTLIFAFVAYMIIALLGGQTNLAILCALIIGALLGFLWFNVHPAQVFMGDCRLARHGRDLGRRVADHRPDPAVAVDRHHLRAAGRLGRAADRLLQDDPQAHLQDGAAASPLRAVRVGRREDHDALLDHRRARGDCSA